MTEADLDRLADPLLSVIGDRRCLYLANDCLGNVGDRMIDAGTSQFLRRYHVGFRRHRVSKPVSRELLDECELILLFGSGSVGKCCRSVSLLRTMAAGWGLPCVLLPSSATDTGEDLSFCEAVVARDGLSQQMFQVTRERRDVILMPDMATWWATNRKGSHDLGDGVFLRDDNAGPDGIDGDHTCRDPIDNCLHPEKYAKLAGEYSSVQTNRLHFALAALSVGTDATLLPCTWHKTRSYWETWYGLYGGRLFWAWGVQR